MLNFPQAYIFKILSIRLEMDARSKNRETCWLVRYTGPAAVNQLPPFWAGSSQQPSVVGWGFTRVDHGRQTSLPAAQ